MNLFKKIWLENLKKNKEPIEKFVEDVGSIKGRFTWTKLDKNNKPIDSLTLNNAVTINGRSSIIRLLAQGASNKVGFINPQDYRISKMRFGNAKLDTNTNVIGTNLELHYYDIGEISRRVNSTDSDILNTPLNPGDILRGAGGRAANFLSSPSANTRPSVTFTTTTAGLASNTGYTFFPGTNIIRPLTGTMEFPNLRVSTDDRAARGPSHESLEILLLDSSDQLIEAIKFETKYNKSISGNKPNLYSVTGGGNPDYNIVPTSSLVTKVLDLQNTKLYYDIDKRWKINLRARSVADFTADTDFAGHRVAKYIVRFNIGQYNIVDSIVPTIGFNTGEGSNNLTRFNNQPDFYNITNTAYADGENTPIDDFSVSFSVIMTAAQGNGEGTPNENRNVYYTEAFLFNEREELFSIIRMDNQNGFIKNPDTAYLLTWQLSVDPN